MAGSGAEARAEVGGGAAAADIAMAAAGEGAAATGDDSVATGGFRDRRPARAWRTT